MLRFNYAYSIPSKKHPFIVNHFSIFYTDKSAYQLLKVELHRITFCKALTTSALSVLNGIIYEQGEFLQRVQVFDEIVFYSRSRKTDKLDRDFSSLRMRKQSCNSHQIGSDVIYTMRCRVGAGKLRGLIFICLVNLRETCRAKLFSFALKLA